MTTATLLSVNLGMPKDVSWRGRTVHTGIWKRPVAGRHMARRLNIDGDGQGDLLGHGGEQRAVLVYQVDSYRHWQDVFGLQELGHGSFGENFTVEGLGDDEVCIGDRFRIGGAEFEVTQPRVTCFRVGMRMGQPRLPSLLVAHHRPGFYMRVLTEGYVEAGDEIVRTATGRHQITVADIDALLYLPDQDRELLRRAVDIPALSPGWQGSFRAMLETGPESETRAPGGVPTGPPPAWDGFRRLVVRDVVAESTTVSSYHLSAEDDAPLPAARPGQYLTLRVPGAGDPIPVRTYSLSGSMSGGWDRAAYRISVKRESLGLVSSYLHGQVRPGDRVDVAAPRGDFLLEDGAGPVLLLSAGIGVTPVLAMLHQLAESGSERDVWWLHATHDAGTFGLAAEASDLVASLPSATSRVFFAAGAEPLPPGVVAGRLTAEVIAGLGIPLDATAYLCGPESFMDQMTEALVAAGLGPANIHQERFSSRTSINPGVVPTDQPPPHQPAGPPGTGPDVTFARSGLTVRSSDDYHPSLLELAEACDVPTRWSCRTGVCHTCVTAVLSGETTYITEPLEPPGPGEALLCISRAVDDLVLDL